MTSVTSVAYLLGIDIGTTAVKAVLVDPAGRILADSSRPNTLRSPRPGWAEEDPAEWWANLRALVPDVLERAGARPEQIAAVGISGAVPCVVLVDAAGQALGPSIQQNDTRAVTEIEALQAATDAADVLARTGSPISQQSVGPKLAWLREHRPDLTARAAWVMGSYDYAALRLTGVPSAERNWALESGLYDLHREAWDEQMPALVGLRREQLPPPRRPHEVVGAVTPAAARETGLPAGTPVVAGSADHIASALSAGLRRPGDLLVKLGGSGDILCCLDAPRVDPRLYLDYHDVPGQFILNGCMAASGSLIRWFREQFAAELDYPALDAAAAPMPPGAEGLILLPYFLGEKTPLNDPLARGTLVGLTLSHTRAHVFRAVLEGISYGFYHHLEVLREHGIAPVRARVTNGGAHSRLWKQITADVLGVTLEPVAGHPGSSLGAAFVAGMGAGVFRSWDEIERFIKLEDPVQPDPAAHERYMGLYPVYREIYEKLKDTYPKITGK